MSNTIQLHGDEVLLLEGYSWIGNNSRGDLFLTNKRIVWVRVGFFSGREEKEWLLTSIKQYQGDPLVELVGGALDPVLQIQHRDGVTKLKFDTRKDATKWFNKIYSTITGQAPSSSKKNTGNYAIPGMDILGKGIKDTVDAFTTGLGIKEVIESEKMISKKCPFCGAPITGSKGEKVVCMYCDGVNVIK